MNKIAIPALLVATVMVAGMFAFAPVEQASTVHTTLASGDNTSLIGEVTDAASTTLTTNGGTTVGTYTYTTDEAVKILEIEVTADFSGQAIVNDAADLLRIQTITLDGRTLDVAGDLPITVAVGNGAANTMGIFNELMFASGAEVVGIGPIAVTPGMDLVVVLNLFENGDDANTAIPITVTFFTEGAGSTLEDVTQS